MENPKITPTVDEKSCCSGGSGKNDCCSSKNCCNSTNLRASIGRIAVGVILLGSMFVFGMKAGMMGDRGGRGKKGCMMGSEKGGCGMDGMGCSMKNNMMKGNTVTPPAPQAEAIPVEVIPAEEIPTAPLEITGTNNQ